MTNDTMNTAETIKTLKGLYKGVYIIDDLTPSEVDLIAKVYIEGVRALHQQWSELGDTVPHASELDAHNYEIIQAIATHAVDWHFENNRQKLFEAEYTVTYTRRVAVQFKCMPGEEDRVASEIQDALAEKSADDSISEYDISVDDAEIEDVSDDGTEHYETEIEGCNEQ